MEARPQHGYLVLADISGYTSFMSSTELDHAHDILSELLELIVQRSTPLLEIAKLEGDAVFAYAPEERITRGETLLEAIEATYVAFRDRVDAVRRSTTCTCRACQAIPTLDLKFCSHHGDYIMQRVRGEHEIVGPDVNLVHRLLKNGVTEATGWRAYALFTEAALEHMGVRPDGLYPQVEQYEHIGDVQTYSLDLHERYHQIIEARRVVVTPESADTSFSIDVPAPPPVVWEWLNAPEKRTLWAGPGAHWSAVLRPGGRTGVGARNHCAHGKSTLIEEVLDWRPFEYVTVRQQQQGGAPFKITTTTQFKPTAEGTRLDFWIKSDMRVPRPVFRLMAKPLSKMYREALQRMAELVREDAVCQLAQPVLADQALSSLAEG